MTIGTVRPNSLLLVKWAYHGITVPIDDYYMEKDMFKWCVDQGDCLIVEHDNFPYPDMADDDDFTGAAIIPSSKEDIAIANDPRVRCCVQRMPYESGYGGGIIEPKVFAYYLGYYAHIGSPPSRHIEVWKCKDNLTHSIMKNLSCVIKDAEDLKRLCT